MSTQQYEVLVLGSGAGGKLLSWHMARAGRRTAVVERRWIGGSCPNINCLPSKNEIWSAKIFDLVHHATVFGMLTGSTAIDMGRVRQRKRDMVDGLVAIANRCRRVPVATAGSASTADEELGAASEPITMLHPCPCLQQPNRTMDAVARGWCAVRMRAR
jgi:choline dehydrogenase-like flavoprotein